MSRGKRLSSKPNVLVFIDWYLPGYKAGGPVRSLANMVERLRDRIDFHIVASDTEYTEEKPYPNVTSDTWTELPGGELVWYASNGNRNARVWKTLLAEKRWDAVYINGIYSRPFSILPLWLLRNSVLRKVVAVRGMLATGPMQHGRAKKRLFLTAGKILGLYRNVRFQATNPEEAGDIRSWLGSDRPVHVVPNLPRKLTPTKPQPRVKRKGETSLVSVARIAKEKNTLLALEALCLVKARVSYDIYGPVYDHDLWRRCQVVIERVPANITVQHLGAIPPDMVQGELHRRHALYMPSEGENFGHTMLEALCAGMPLIIGDNTPWRGLEVQQAGWDIPVNRTDAASLLASCVERLAAMDQTEYDRWSAGSFAMGERYLADPSAERSTIEMFVG